MLQVIKASLPGTIAFLVIAFAIGVMLLRKPRTSRFGRRWLTGLLLLYAVFSIPVTAAWLAAPLAWGFHPLESRETAHGAQAIVVLDGGTRRFRDQAHSIEIPLDTSALRALEALRIYRLLDHPLVFVSGGDNQPDPAWRPEASALRDQLITGGVPAERIVLDSNSINTRFHAVNLVRMLTDRAIEKFVLVTSPSHMRRAILAFQAEGKRPVASPSKSTLDPYRGWAAFWPSTSALEFTQATMHEYIGIMYYFVRKYI